MNNKIFLKFYPEYKDKKLENNMIHGKIISLNSFYELYPEFDIQFYKFLYLKELENIYDIDILVHWHNIGVKENRISSLNEFKKKYPNIILNSEKSIIEWFQNNYMKHKINYEMNHQINNFFIKNNVSNFNYNEFINFNQDCSINDFTYFFKKISFQKKNVILSLQDFYNKYPNFNLDIYKLFNKNIFFPTNEEYIYHWYHNHTHNKDIIYCTKMFYEKYPDFNYEIFTLFHKNDLKNIDNSNNNYYLEILSYFDSNLSNKFIYSVKSYNELYPFIRVETYKKIFLKDKNISDIECIIHIYNHLILGDTIYEIKNRVLNKMNINIYRNLNYENINLTDNELIEKWLLIDSNNNHNKIFNKESFYKAYPEYEFFKTIDNSDGYENEEDKIVYMMKGGIYKYQSERKIVNNISEVLIDLDQPKYKLNPGISLIIRAKNEELNVSKCIESIVDLVDEIIFVDNGSTDNTYKMVEGYSKIYENIKLYKYNIKVTRAGEDHKLAMQRDDKNTLGLFYNWCLSKAKYYNVFKWDADFICIRNNFIDLVKLYNLKNRNDRFAIWFTGKTLFESNNSYYINYKSFYDEYRIFSYLNDFKWYDGEICEFTEPYLKKIESRKKYKYPYPLFYEIKRTSIDEFSERSSLIDKRDINDYNIIQNLKSTRLPNQLILIHNSIINNIKRILLITPSLSLGGGNQFILNMYNVIKSFGYIVKILALNNVKIGNDKFSNIIEDDILENNNDTNDYNYDIIFFNGTIHISEKKLGEIIKKSKIFFITHSDVAYSNYFITKYHNYFDRIITVNNYTITKLSNSLNIDKNKFYKLINYFDNKEESKTLGSKNKFCMISRFSDDKNVPMLLYALKILFQKYEGYKFYLVGCGDSPDYDNYLSFLVNKLDIRKNIVFEGYQKDVQKYYLKSDFVILPSVSEGCPYNLIEAMFFDTPVITSNVGGNHELIKHNKNGILIEYDNIRLLEKERIYIQNYNEHLSELGYITDISNYNYTLSYKLNVYPPPLLQPKDNNFLEYKLKLKLWNENVDKILNSMIQMIELKDERKTEFITESKNFIKNTFNQNIYVSSIVELL
jgi:glycosyltransferase involved in cell wall biosynthesis